MSERANQLRPGNVIRHNDRLWKVIKADHVKPGKGGAYMKMELKALEGGTKLDTRFHSDDTIAIAYLEERKALYLYDQGDTFVFMDQETSDQIELPHSAVGDQKDFLSDNMEVTLLYDAATNRVLSVNLPATVVLEVVDAEGVVKGQTASASFKTAQLENGLSIMVPPHITAGTRVVVNTSDGTYVERAK